MVQKQHGGCNSGYAFPVKHKPQTTTTVYSIHSDSKEKHGFSLASILGPKMEIALNVNDQQLCSRLVKKKGKKRKRLNKQRRATQRN